MRSIRVASLVVLLLLPLYVDVADSKMDDLKELVRDAFKDCKLIRQKTCPDHKHMMYLLFTRQNRKIETKTERRIYVEGTELWGEGKKFYNPSRPNKVIIHGLDPQLYVKDLLSVKTEYLHKEDANVWMVSWAPLAKGGLCLGLSVLNTDYVARCVVNLIQAIEQSTSQAQIHVVAEGAGTMVAHSLARFLEQGPAIRLARITGLNPEMIAVPGLNGDRRLSSSDAEFVDVIHTSPLMPQMETFGHIDFYVNPDRFHQPNCDGEKSVCDRQRAIQYFKESIISEVGFVGWECPTYTSFSLGICLPGNTPRTMGEPCELGASGIYITYTAEKTPYALGHWEGELYKTKGPKERTDIIAQYSNAVLRKKEEIEAKTPQILKDLGVYDYLKSRLTDKTEDFNTTALDIGLKGIKAFLTNYTNNKQILTDRNSVQNVADTVNDNVGEIEITGKVAGVATG